MRGSRSRVCIIPWFRWTLASVSAEFWSLSQIIPYNVIRKRLILDIFDIINHIRKRKDDGKGAFSIIRFSKNVLYLFLSRLHFRTLFQLKKTPLGLSPLRSFAEWRESFKLNQCVSLDPAERSRLNLVYCFFLYSHCVLFYTV